MEEGVNDINDDNNEKYDYEKEAECPYDTSPIDTEKRVRNINDDKNEKMMRKKRQNAQMTLLLFRWRKV